MSGLYEYAGANNLLIGEKHYTRSNLQGGREQVGGGGGGGGGGIISVWHAI